VGLLMKRDGIQDDRKLLAVGPLPAHHRARAPILKARFEVFFPNIGGLQNMRVVIDLTISLVHAVSLRGDKCGC
jgi:hypothetical protein